MPSGSVHYRIYSKKRKYIKYIAAILSVITYGVTKQITWSFLLGIGFVIGYNLGRWIDPDQDTLINDADGRLMRELGIFGAIIVAWFILYAYLMRFVGIGRKGHRNFFSHFPGVSTIIRLIYALAVPEFILVYGIYKWGWVFPVQGWYAVAGVWLGLSWADMFHYWADFHGIGNLDR